MPSDASRLAFGEVVLVPFPFTDQSTSKRRPAVVISGRSYNESRPDVILMPVTSQVRAEARSGDVPLDAWEAAGLLKPSAVKPVIATLAGTLVLRRLGSLESDDRAALKRALKSILG